MLLLFFLFFMEISNLLFANSYWSSVLIFTSHFVWPIWKLLLVAHLAHLVAYCTTGDCCCSNFQDQIIWKYITLKVVCTINMIGSENVANPKVYKLQTFFLKISKANMKKLSFCDFLVLPQDALCTLKGQLFLLSTPSSLYSLCLAPCIYS